MSDPMTSTTSLDTPFGTILIVDDNPTNLKVVGDDLKARGFRTAIASNGELALKRARHLRPDLILLDVMMPGIDGFETCRRLKADDTTREIPVIFMTALAQTEHKVQGFAVGGVDYITKPIQHEEVFAHITTHLQIRQLTQRLQTQTIELSTANAQISGLNAQLTDDNLRMHTEMELARQIQTALLPTQIRHLHPDFEIAAVMQPAAEVGGDYYDLLLDQEQRLWLGIGDVSGHGVTPGLIMMIAQTVKTAITLNFQVTPREVVTMANKVLYHSVHERLHTDQFMTFTSLKYLGDGRFQHAGDHLDLVVYRAQAGRCETLATDGAWLNLIPNIKAVTHNAEFVMAVGDLLVLYTDGLTEAEDESRKLLDMPRFLDIITAHAAQDVEVMCDAVMRDVLTWCQHIQDDDMTLVVARRIR